MALFVHVGQCGCSVGYEFWKMMEKEKRHCAEAFKTGYFFDSKNNARAMLMDAEPKVIQQILKV